MRAHTHRKVVIRVLRQRRLQRLLRRRGVCCVHGVHVQLDAQDALQDAAQRQPLLLAAQPLRQQRVAVLRQRLVAVGVPVAPAARGERKRERSSESQGGARGAAECVACACSSDKCLVCRSV